VREFLKEYNAEILKYMLLSVHYRSPSDFSEQGIEFAVTGLARIYSALNLAAKTLDAGAGVSGGAPAKSLATAIEAADKAIREALDDDFNTPEMLAAMYTVIRTFNAQIRLGQKVTPEAAASATRFRDWILEQGRLLSLFQEKPAEYLRLLDDMLLSQKGLERAAIDKLVEERTAVRAAKDFKKSDELRDKMVAMGIALQDTPSGTSWEVAK
jgi:cysteinyl-tRNA synthetase